MIDAFCDKLTCLIKSNIQGINEEKAEIINFGIKSIVSETSKILIILLSGYFFGVINYVLIAIISYGLYRTYAGGVHAKTHLICLMSSMVIIYSNIYLSMYLGKNINKFWPLYAIIYIFNCMNIYFYAPADVEEKPILSKKLREKLRIKSFIIMSLINTLSFFIISDQIIACILLFSTLFVSITLMPVSYKIMGCKHGHEGSIQ